MLVDAFKTMINKHNKKVLTSLHGKYKKLLTTFINLSFSQ